MLFCHSFRLRQSWYRLYTLQIRKPFYFSFRFNYQFQVQIHFRHGSHSVPYSDPSYSLDILQTRKSFCYSYRSQLQVQSRYAPDTDAIMLLIQIQTSRYSTDTLQTRMPFWPLHQKFDSPQCSRHESYSVTYSDPSYSSDTLQTQKSFFYSYRSQPQIQSRYAPGADAILSLILIFPT